MNDLQFLSNACNMLKVSNTVLCTAQYYYHLCHQSLGEFDLFVVMAAILNLSVKQNEVERKLRDTLNVCYYLCNLQRLRIDERFWELKSLVIQAEFMIAKSLNFDTNVALPHNYCIVMLYEIEKELIDSQKCNRIEFQRFCQATLAIVTRIFYDKIVIPKDHDWNSKKDRAWNLAIASIFLGTQVVQLKYKNLENLVKDWQGSKEIIEEIVEKQISLVQNL